MIIPAVLLIIAAAVIYFLFFFNKSVSYRKAEENYFGNMFAAASNENGELQNAQPQKTNIDVSIPMGSVAGIDLSEISLEFDGAVSGENIYSAINAAFGGKSLTAECWFDSAENRAILLLPEISDIYAVMDIPESTDNEAEAYLNAINEVFSKAGEAYFEIIGEPEVIKNQEFTVGDSTYTADKSVIHLDAPQLAKTARAFIDSVLDNELLTAALCEAQGVDSKEELLAGELGEGLDSLDSIINGEKVTSTAFDMTVYMKNQTVIGREAVFTDAEGEVSGCINIYEIPEKNGQTTCVTVKDDEKEALSLLCRDEVSGEIHNGTLEVTVNESAFTVSYSNLAMTDKLFQGDATITSEDNPALVITASLKTEGQVKTAVLSVPNIVNVTITVQPSVLEYKEMPQLSEGQYAVITDENANESEAYQRFMEGVSGFLMDLLGLGGYTAPNHYTDEMSGIDPNNINLLSMWDLMTGGAAPEGNIPADSSSVNENKPVSNNNGNTNNTNNNNSVNTPVGNTSDNGGSLITPVGNVSDDGSNVGNTSDNENGENQSGSTPNAENTNGSNSSGSENNTPAESTDNTPENNGENTQGNSSSGNQSSTGGNQGTAGSNANSGLGNSGLIEQLQLSGAQYVTNSGLDAFNSISPYKVEIYVDTAVAVNDKVTVSEKPRWELSAAAPLYADYTKGGCLQVDFAEDMYFDSALILFTIPNNLINSGRYYPNSNILRGIGRYAVMSGTYGCETETVAELLPLSYNQIGILTDQSGYYMLADMDAMYYNVFGMSPDEMTALYEW